MSRQQFALQPRRVNAALGQKLGAALDHFQDGHWPIVSRSPQPRKEGFCLLPELAGVERSAASRVLPQIFSRTIVSSRLFWRKSSSLSRAMDLTFTCPNCRQELEADTTQAGT